MDSSSSKSNSGAYIDRARYDKALELWPGFERKTLREYAYVARKSSIRMDDLSWGHHQVVVPLSPPEQREWLEAALRNGWTVAELRHELRRRRAATPLMPEGQFGTIVADPPWEVGAGPGWLTSGKSRLLTYPMLTVEEITALELPAAMDAHLYLWTINRYVRDAYDIAEAWGFEPSTLLVWAKAPHGLGPGGTYALTTEYALFATRGAVAASRRVDTTWFQWKRGAHSVKPDAFYALVESISPGPYLDLFARRPREGWVVWGDEVAA